MNPNNPHDNGIQRVVRVLTSVPVMLADQMPIEGISNLLEGLRGKRGYMIEKTTAGYLEQLIPRAGMFRWLEQIVDPTLSKPTNVGEMIAAKIPILSSMMVPPRLDSDGNPVTQDRLGAFLPYRVGMEDEELAAKAKRYPIHKAIWVAGDEGADEDQKRVAMRVMKGKSDAEVLALLQEHADGMKVAGPRGTKVPASTSEYKNGKKTAYGERVDRIFELLDRTKN
jgi:hypothetical protein